MPNDPAAAVEIVLTVPLQDQRDMQAAAQRVGLTIEEWILTLTEGPLRYARECRAQDERPKRRRRREHD